MVTSEEMGRFSMHAFRCFDQALCVDVLAKFNARGCEIQNTKTAGGQLFEGQLGTGLVQYSNHLPKVGGKEEPLVGRKMEQLYQELSPAYERLENATKRSNRASFCYLKSMQCVERLPPFSRSTSVNSTKRFY